MFPLLLKELIFISLFVVIATSVVQGSGPKEQHRKSFIVRIIAFFGSFKSADMSEK